MPSIADTYFSIPELMRAARGSYKRSIDAVYAARGIDDVPNPGGFILAYLVGGGHEDIPAMVEGLGVSQRQYDELLDKLTLRGFIARSIDPENGSTSLVLTERGRAAAQAIFDGGRMVDEELERRLTADEIAAMRRGLAALGEIKQSLPKIR